MTQGYADFQMTKHERSILVMDGDPRIGSMISDKLRDHGFCCASVSDPATAQDEVRKEAWSMVLLDMHLPENGALDLAALVRSHPARPEIVMMADNVHKAIFTGHQAGACTVLAKPLNVDQVLAAVHRFCPQGPGSRRFEADLAHPAVSALFDSIVTNGRRLEVAIEASDIGRGGFFMRVANGQRIPDIGQVIDFDLKLGMVPNTRFGGRGIVRWVYRDADRTGVGIEFLSIPADEEKLVGAFADLFKVMPFVPIPEGVKKKN
jgi:CheY-like chemotaxis protein